jgi:hypothetical protein
VVRDEGKVGIEELWSSGDTEITLLFIPSIISACTEVSTETPAPPQLAHCY